MDPSNKDAQEIELEESLTKISRSMKECDFIFKALRIANTSISFGSFDLHILGEHKYHFLSLIPKNYRNNCQI